MIAFTATATATSTSTFTSSSSAPSTSSSSSLSSLSSLSSSSSCVSLWQHHKLRSVCHLMIIYLQDAKEYQVNKPIRRWTAMKRLTTDGCIRTSAYQWGKIIYTVTVSDVADSGRSSTCSSLTLEFPAAYVPLNQLTFSPPSSGHGIPAHVDTHWCSLKSFSLHLKLTSGHIHCHTHTHTHTQTHTHTRTHAHTHTHKHTHSREGKGWLFCYMIMWLMFHGVIVSVLLLLLLIFLFGDPCLAVPATISSIFLHPLPPHSTPPPNLCSMSPLLHLHLLLLLLCPQVPSLSYPLPFACLLLLLSGSFPMATPTHLPFNGLCQLETFERDKQESQQHSR